MKTASYPVTLIAAALTLTGCAAATPETPNPAPTQVVEPDTTPVVNERGNLQKVIGQEGAMLFPGTDREAITFKVTAIEKDPECTGDPMWYFPPDNGLYVALTMDITTSDDYLELMGAGQPLRLFWQDWKIYLPDGTTIETTPNGYGCFPEEDQLPLDIPAGATSIGKYVLDVPLDAVSVAWFPTGVYGIGKDDGWEWVLD